MVIKLQNSKATIEDFYKGVVGEIIFEEIGEDLNFLVIDKKKFAEDIAKNICEDKEDVFVSEVYKKVDDVLENYRDLLIEYIIEYIRENFEGDYHE